MDATFGVGVVFGKFIQIEDQLSLFKSRPLMHFRHQILHLWTDGELWKILEGKKFRAKVHKKGQTTFHAENTMHETTGSKIEKPDNQWLLQIGG